MPSAGKKLQERSEKRGKVDRKTGLPFAADDSTNTLGIRLTEILGIQVDPVYSLVISNVDRGVCRFGAVKIVLIQKAEAGKVPLHRLGSHEREEGVNAIFRIMIR